MSTTGRYRGRRRGCWYSMMKWTTPLFLVAVLVVSASGCTHRPVTIGAVYPLSGPQAAAGEEVRQGIELAVDIIDGQYPQLDLPLAGSRGLPAFGGRPLEVVFADHGSTDAGAREKTRQLIAYRHVVALMGAYESSKTKVVSQIAEDAGIPFLCATSTDPALTERGFEWFFRTTPTDATFANDAFRFMSDLNAQRNAGLQRLAVVHESTDFGTGFMDLVAILAPQYGMQVVEEVTSQGVADSVPAEVASINTAQPDAVLFAVYAQDAIRYIQEFKRQDYAPPLVWANDAGFVSPDFQQTLGADAAYVTSREVWSVDITLTNTLAAEVNALFRERYGTDLNGNSVRGFIGMMTLAEAINRAGTTDPAAVRDALRATDIPAEQLIAPWQGVRFDERGQNILGDGIVVQMLGNRYTAVWPDGIAVESVVFPFPAWGT